MSDPTQLELDLDAPRPFLVSVQHLRTYRIIAKSTREAEAAVLAADVIAPEDRLLAVVREEMHESFPHPPRPEPRRRDRLERPGPGGPPVGGGTSGAGRPFVPAEVTDARAVA